jgi:O-methyltransferase
MKRSIYRRLLDAAWAFASDMQYRTDGLGSVHASDFMKDERFLRAYTAGMSTNPGFGKNLHIEWRVFVCCWAAQQALVRGADLAECGVNTGINALSIANYLQLDLHPEIRFYLLDTFRGIPEQQTAPAERRNADRLNKFYDDCYDKVVKAFAPFKSVRIIQGTIPETLVQVDSDRLGFLSIDMNIAFPERAALEYFWDRLVPGAVIVLDDYGWKGHELQRKAHDDFAASKGLAVLTLPTGQGIILKP